MIKSIGILGAGGFGTALASVLVRNQHKVYLWDRDQEVLDNIKTYNINQKYLADITLPKGITCVAGVEDLLDQVDYLLIAVPSHSFIEVLNHLGSNQYISKLKKLIWVTKGLARDGDFLSNKVKAWSTLNCPALKYGLLTGPSFARELAQKLPAAIVSASNDLAFAEDIADLFRSEVLRVYPTQDVLGAQLGGVIKNILAVACGISDGLKLGCNARAALITRGMLEMQRLGMALGVKTETLYGLAGMGDVILTCTDDQSRNRRFGILLSQGYERSKASAEVKQVVEAEHNVSQVYELSKKYSIDMPITEQVFKMINHQIKPQAALEKLFQRLPKLDG